VKLAVEAYIDIETTGLSPYYHDITVVGLYVCSDTATQLVQLVGEDATGGNLLEVLYGVDLIYSYNGSRFDLPFIKASLGIDLDREVKHRDLMLDCWSRNLYGGLKVVERKLGIPRHLKDVDGKEAVRLWWRYKIYHDHNALNTLLEYNREDVVNLKILREKLDRYRV
jgi:hypothetical protein